MQRITVTLPEQVLREVDREARNRSGFVLEAIRRELRRRRREALQRSFDSPHPESESLAEAGFEAWASSLPDEGAGDLVDAAAGTPVHWTPGNGWREDTG